MPAISAMSSTPPLNPPLQKARGRRPRPTAIYVHVAAKTKKLLLKHNERQQKPVLRKHWFLLSLVRVLPAHTFFEADIAGIANDEVIKQLNIKDLAGR